MPLTVACVLRSGPRHIDKRPYTPEHVRKLRAGVAAHLPVAHRFVCLTDTPEDVEAVGIEAIALPTDWAGWWCKINLFAPDYLTGPTLYFDLDTLIVGDLTPLVRTAPGVTMVADFYGAHMMNSSTMAWNGDFCAIWHVFADDPATLASRYDRRKGSLVGDQGFIHDVLRNMAQNIDTFDPAHVVSFRRSAQEGIPPGARAIAFHGILKCDNPDTGWAYKQWSAL